MMQNTIYALVAFMLALLAATKPVGLWIEPLARGEAPALIRGLDKGVLKLLGIRGHEQTWQRYVTSLLLFNVAGFVFLYLLLRLQGYLPLNPTEVGAMPAFQALNTAVSFVTNTNWQSYAGETGVSHLTQMMGLAVQNFLSAATGIAVAFVLMRGFARAKTETVGNFWVDVTRVTLWLLIPLSFVFALFLIGEGVVQTWAGSTTVTTLAGDSQTVGLGPVASQEAIKLLGTNGGGFFNVNSAHPFENPTPLSNFFEAFAIFLIPAALTYAFGRVVGNTRQGWVIWAAMGAIFAGAFLLFAWAESAGNPILTAIGAQEGMSMEGKDVRFDLGATTLFSVVTTSASCGAVNNLHDTLMPVAGMVTMWLMQIGEVVFGGVGSGFYGMLIMAVLGVFIAGLMVGRTPEYLGKKIAPREMKVASMAILVTPILTLAGAAMSLVLPDALSSLNNGSAHGLSEILYAWSSAANNNGSAFGGLNADTAWFNIGLAFAMWLGRFLVIVLVVALSGMLARAKHVPVTSGTLPTDGVLFVVLLIGVVVLIGALTFLPALALGPVAEHVMLY